MVYPGVYKHYSGNYYKVLYVVPCLELNDKVVIYRRILEDATYPDDNIFARSMKYFESKMEVPRFERLT